MRPLEGIRVLDFSRVLAGPFASQIMAELGSEVIKVERPGTGDETRSFEPKFKHGESGYFFAFNRGKHSLTLNLKSDTGRDIARRLARQADVIVENFLPGEMDGMGLGHAALSAENPRLVYISNTGFGQSGPYKDRSGYDTIFQALSGVMALTGYPDSPPAKVGLPFADLTSGLWIVIAALTGIVARATTQQGCYVDLSMMDVQTSLLTIAAARLFALDEDPSRTGTEHPGRVPSAAFQCRDGAWIHISGGDQHWRAICDVLGLAELAEDETLRRNVGRVAARKRVMDRMRDAIALRDRDDLAASLRAAGVPAGEVNTVRQALDDPHAIARALVQHFDHPIEGRVPGLRGPLRFDRYDDPAFAAPPVLGASTEMILSTRLGLSQAEIALLRAEGVV